VGDTGNYRPQISKEKQPRGKGKADILLAHAKGKKAANGMQDNYSKKSEN